MGISTHVLDTAKGRPAEGVGITLEDDRGVIARGVTDADGRLKLIGAEGESIAGPTFRIGNTNSRIRFPSAPAAFFDSWCVEGPTHHVALGVGHTADTILKLANLQGLECKLM